ncbi:hypothetical protein OG259_09665 [Streptomyces sp. NBC_00250]|uniref:hypothetical protein n=1 Tax=Streptomyces sp. NBC_00250 TaxID=2903641 RepID=UPI002E2C3F05|nr:hypothetical protein [Streptomyces sp. NBC_00250]
MKKNLIILALCGTALLTACGQGQKPGQESPAAIGEVPRVETAAGWTQVKREGWPEAVPAQGLAQGLTLPIERYLVPYADEIAFLEGRGNAEIKCMRALGFPDWRTETLGVNPPISGSSSNMERRYGLTIRSEAEQTGYHVPGKSEVSTAALAEQETPRAVVALKGAENAKAVRTFEGKAVPEGGCVGESRRQAPSPDIALAEELSGQSFMASQETPEVKTAMAAWSACMKENGHQAATVWEAANLTDPTSPSAGAEEKKIALAEIDCKQKTDLVAIWFKAEQEIQEELISKNRAALETARNKTVTNVESARQVTASVR